MAPRKYHLGKRTAALEETRRRILDATVALHDEKGVLDTSWSDIAQRADVAVGTVLRHFPSLDDLVRACGERVMAIANPPTADLFANLKSTSERVEPLVRKLFATYVRVARRWQLAFRDAEKVPALTEWFGQWQAGHEALVREALAPMPDNERAVLATLALTDYFVWKSLTSRGMTSEAAADLVSGILLAWLDRSFAEGKGVGYAQQTG